MQRADLERFTSLMGEVYECFGHRAPAPGALTHWVDALRDHPFHVVDGALRMWLKTKHKPPVIAEIVKSCGERLSDSVESRAEADKAAFGGGVVWRGVTPYGAKCIAEMRAMLRNPRPPSKNWARKILENPHSTEFQRRFAAPVYATMDRQIVVERITAAPIGSVRTEVDI